MFEQHGLTGINKLQYNRFGINNHSPEFGVTLKHVSLLKALSFISTIPCGMTRSSDIYYYEALLTLFLFTKLPTGLLINFAFDDSNLTQLTVPFSLNFL